MANRDWWPFSRLLITAAVLGSAAHFFLGWQVRPQALVSMGIQSFGVLSLLAMISFVLADLYLLLFLFPLLIVGVLNDWFYSASRWTCQVVLRLRAASLLAVGGLCGEILLFGGLAFLLRRFFL